MHMVNLAGCAALFAVVALASTSALAADCAADADEANAKCYPTLQAAVDAALSTDRPLVLARGTYRITAPLVIDYSQHAGTGFELISHGATIDGTAARGPALIIECAADCFYFHQEGTLFANADTDGPAVVASPYLNCPTGLVYSRNSTTLGQIGWQLGGDVRTPFLQK
jgi:hypothetical protein